MKEDYWDFVTELIELSEAKKFGNKIYKWIKKQHLKSKEDLDDLDERMAEAFGISEEKAGKIVAIYVRHKAGGFDEKEVVSKIDTVK